MHEWIVRSYTDGIGVGDTLSQVLSLLKSTTSYCDLDTRLCEDVNSGSSAVNVSLKYSLMSA
jgi:hypothetical protein